MSGDTHGYLKTRMKNAILDYSISQTNLSLNNNHNYFLQYPDPNLTTTQIFTAVRISIVKKITTINNNNNKNPSQSILQEDVQPGKDLALFLSHNSSNASPWVIFI